MNEYISSLLPDSPNDEQAVESYPNATRHEARVHQKYLHGLSIGLIGRAIRFLVTVAHAVTPGGGGGGGGGDGRGVTCKLK